LCVIQITASPFVPFHLAIVLCHSNYSKWKGANGEAVIWMTHNTMAKWKRINGKL
jgi:hypothetical protein